MYASLDQAFAFPFNEIKSLAPVEKTTSCTNMMRHMRSCQHCRTKLQHLIETELTHKPHHEYDSRYQRGVYNDSILPDINKTKIIKLLIAILIAIIIIPLIIKTAKNIS